MVMPSLLSTLYLVSERVGVFLLRWPQRTMLRVQDGCLLCCLLHAGEASLDHPEGPGQSRGTPAAPWRHTQPPSGSARQDVRGCLSTPFLDASGKSKGGSKSAFKVSNPAKKC